MRHRRRISTQTIRKKNITSSPRPAAPKPSGNVFKWIKLVVYLTIIVFGGYFVYGYVAPFFDSVPQNNNIATEDSQSQDKTPTFPVEQPVEGEKQQRSPLKRKIQVEVLNGCGEQGIAKLLADRLRTHSYDVVNMGNYIEKGKVNFKVNNSKIIDQINSEDSNTNSRELAKIMGVEMAFVDYFENPSPIADITIVIGLDFKELPIFKDN